MKLLLTLSLCLLVAVSHAQWTKIWSCSTDGDGAFVSGLNQNLVAQIAQDATAVMIATNSNPNYFVFAQTPSYAITSLRSGKSLSHSITNGMAVVSDWSGSMVSYLGNSCGTSQPLDQSVYWACNNQNGLHITSSLCRWSYSQGTPYSGIGVWIFLNTKWTPYWSCAGDTGSWISGVNRTTFQEAANYASRVKISSDNNARYITSLENQYPIINARAGVSLSHPTTGGWANTAAWTGTENPFRTANSCGNSESLDERIYWACNNQEGLHVGITYNQCRWQYNTVNSATGLTLSLNDKSTKSCFLLETGKPYCQWIPEAGAALVEGQQFLLRSKYIATTLDINAVQNPVRMWRDFFKFQYGTLRTNNYLDYQDPNGQPNSANVLYINTPRKITDGEWEVTLKNTPYTASFADIYVRYYPNCFTGAGFENYPSSHANRRLRITAGNGNTVKLRARQPTPDPCDKFAAIIESNLAFQYDNIDPKAYEFELYVEFTQ